MHAQLLTAVGKPLDAADLPAPRPGAGQVLIEMRACAVCRTDLHIIDGELPDPKLPLVSLRRGRLPLPRCRRGAFRALTVVQFDVFEIARLAVDAGARRRDP